MDSREPIDGSTQGNLQEARPGLIRRCLWRYCRGPSFESTDALNPFICARASGFNYRSSLDSLLQFKPLRATPTEPSSKGKNTLQCRLGRRTQAPSQGELVRRQYWCGRGDELQHLRVDPHTDRVGLEVASSYAQAWYFATRLTKRVRSLGLALWPET